MFDQEDQNELKQLLREVLEERKSIDPEDHRRHHEQIIPEWEAREEAKRQRTEKAKQAAIGALVVVIAGAVFSGLAKIGATALQMMAKISGH